MKEYLLLLFSAICLQGCYGSEDYPNVSIRFEPQSPIIESDHVNVTIHCDVLEGSPRILLNVQWMKDGMALTELPECNNSFEKDDSNADDSEKPRKNQNNFCFIDSTKILLLNVNRDFIGNYSCRGYNEAGWGGESEAKLLDVFYEPGNASISLSPQIPLKRKKMVLSCFVEDLGNPKATRFQWFQGDDPIKDILTAEWKIDPVSLHSRKNFSCFAYNDGGNGTSASINVDVHVPPTFISKLHPYSGFLFSDPHISLSCRVECVPNCYIYWSRDGQEITNSNEKYLIKNTLFPADWSTGDFESVRSELVFNISAWPNHRLDIHKDNANYTCSSSNNSVSLGVRSHTSFNVEYPPENVTITPSEVQVVEGGEMPPLLCAASAHPSPKFFWKRLEASESVRGFDYAEVLTTAAALTFPRELKRSNKGVYSCVVQNKHGSKDANVTINILYAPDCTITRSEENGEHTLICVAHGNPDDYKYEWNFKSENETNINKVFEGKDRDKKSYLKLSDLSKSRTYVCRAENSIGFGSYCEIFVEALTWQDVFRPIEWPIISGIDKMISKGSRNWY